MWHPWRTEQTQYLMVYWVLNTFTLVLPLSSHWSYYHSFPMSDNPADMHAQPWTMHSDGVVPHALPPLPLSDSHLKHPRLPWIPNIIFISIPSSPMSLCLITLIPGLLLMGLPRWMLRALITLPKWLSEDVLSWLDVSSRIPSKIMLPALLFLPSCAMTFTSVNQIICLLLISFYLPLLWHTELAQS